MASNWTLLHSANLSRNRIATWTQFYDVYDTAGNWIGSEPITYKDVPPVLSPEAILNLGTFYGFRYVEQTSHGGGRPASPGSLSS